MVEPHYFSCLPQSLHRFALFAAISNICDQESFATNEEFELGITGVANMLCSRSPPKLSTDEKVFIDQDMCKNGKMKSY